MGRGFEELEIWQEAFYLSCDVYKNFMNLKDFGFKDQITRSGLSVVSNIAEGYERNSDIEFKRFLLIAKGSSGELRTQLLIAKNINYIDENIADNLIERSVLISKKIYNFIKFLKKESKRMF
jgi:four helix bundle protein